MKREVTFNKNQEKIHKLRKERLEREQNRFGKIEKHLNYKEDLIDIKRDNFGLGKKNKGGASFNIVTLDYDNSKDGKKLKVIDTDAKVRSLMRSRVIDAKNNGAYDILTGVARQPVRVPFHDRYNPAKSAGQQIISSSSRRSQAALPVPTP